MVSFFNTKEYMLYKKVADAVMKLNSEKNNDLYIKSLTACRAVARDRFNNIGWNESIGRYKWEPLSLSDIGPRYINCGTDFSFVPGCTLFIREDNPRNIALKDTSGGVWYYSEDEMNEIKNCTVKQLREIHSIKSMFEGEIIYGDEKGKHFSRKNKKILERKRF